VQYLSNFNGKAQTQFRVRFHYLTVTLYQGAINTQENKAEMGGLWAEVTPGSKAEMGGLWAEVNGGSKALYKYSISSPLLFHSPVSISA